MLRDVIKDLVELLGQMETVTAEKHASLWQLDHSCTCFSYTLVIVCHWLVFQLSVPWSKEHNDIGCLASWKQHTHREMKVMIPSKEHTNYAVKAISGGHLLLSICGFAFFLNACFPNCLPLNAGSCCPGESQRMTWWKPQCFCTENVDSYSPFESVEQVVEAVLRWVSMVMDSSSSIIINLKPFF